MPNHVKSIVTITGPKKSIQALLDLAVLPVPGAKPDGGETERFFDFDKIVPTSKLAKMSEEGKLSTDQVGEFHLPYWYTWRVDNWGTKWNSYEYAVIEDFDETRSTGREAKYVLAFQTAWSAPDLIFKAIVRKFHALKLHVEYADEDIGSNCGIFGVAYNRETKKVDLRHTSCDGDSGFAKKVWETF